MSCSSRSSSKRRWRRCEDDTRRESDAQPRTRLDPLRPGRGRWPHVPPAGSRSTVTSIGSSQRMRNADALELLRQQGVLLESAQGPIPNLAELVAGQKIRGRWWAHPAGHSIFRVTRYLRSSPEVLTCCLVNGKITFVHRRLWPALVRLASYFDAPRLAAVREVHTPSGSHRRETTAFPDWVPADVIETAASLSTREAREQLASLLNLTKHSPR
jgi:hypothetical protein